MIEIKKKLRHLLIPAQKALITTSVYYELDPREKLIFIAYNLKLPIDNIIGYTRTKNLKYYILEVEVIEDDICYCLNSDNNFIVSIADSFGGFMINPYGKKIPGYQYSDALVLKNILEKYLNKNLRIVIYDTYKEKVVNYGKEDTIDRIIINKEMLDHRALERLSSYKNYGLVKDDEITLAVEENFKGSILSEALLYKIENWCKENKDYELAPEDAESTDMELHGKFFITINNPSTYIKDARIAILRKRKLGE